MQFTQPRVWDRRTKKTTILRSAQINSTARISHFRYALLIFSFILVPNLQAAPSGGQIVGGVGSIHQSGLTTTIQQQTGAMAIDWNKFNVNVDERVQFQQPDVSSIALNRILDQLPSQINGRLDANGRIVLVNPNGLFFGNNASINVGGLIASGLDIDPMDFMNGDYQFQALENSAGTVFNAGLIQASLGGSVALLGKQVQNQGMISADLGIVALAAGKQAVLTFDHSGLLGLRITEAVLQDELGIDPAVLNSGDISAAGGKVLMTASVSQDVFSQAVNTGALQAARSVVVNADGSVTLGSGADLVNTGTVDVSGDTAGQIVMLGENITQRGVIRADQQTTTDTTNPTAGQIELHAQDTLLLTDNSLTSASADTGRGGEITLLGNQIGLFDQARLALNGDTGGGSLLFGGDLRGENPDIPNASAIYIGEATSIQADAIRDGDGGRIIIYATDSAKVFGNISATGGALGGDGGFLETSAGVVNLDFAVDVGAANGSNGQWLIDPFNLSICSGDDCNDDATQNGNEFIADLMDSELDVQTLVAALVTGDVTVETGAEGSNEPNGGNITLDAELDYNGSKSRKLTLNAHHDIIINHSIFDSDSDSNDTLNLVFNADSNGTAGGDVVINDGVVINTNDGSFSAEGVDFNLANGSSIDTGSGDFAIVMDGLVDADGKLVVGGDAYIETRNGPIELLNTGNLFTGAVALESSGNNAIELVNSSDLELDRIVLEDGALTITANDGGITQSAVIVQIGDNPGNVTITAKKGSIDLNSSNNGLYGAVSLNSGGNASLVNDAHLTLAESSIDGDLTIKADGNITQTGALVIDGLADLDAAGDIILDDFPNDFASLQLTANTARVQDQNGIILGNSSTKNELIIEGNGDINASNGALSVGGNTVIIANDGSILLSNPGNSFFGIVTLVNSGTNAIDIVNSRGLELGEIGLEDGALTITANDGDITQIGQIEQTGIGAVMITAEKGSIDLSDLNNEFLGAVSLNSGGTASLVNTTDLKLAKSSIDRDLTIKADGNITQTDALVIGGLAHLTAADDIILDDFPNDFASLRLSANTARVQDQNGITLRDIFITNNLTIVSDGDIDSSNGVFSVDGDTVIIANDGSILLSHKFNYFIGAVSLVNSGTNAIEIVSSGNLELGEIVLEDGAFTITTTFGDFDITQIGAIVQTGENPGNVTIDTFGGSIDLSDSNNEFLGAVSLYSGENTSLVNSVALTLAESSIAGDLTIKAITGNITQTDKLKVVGSASFNVADGESIILNDARNNIRNVSFTPVLKNLEFASKHAITLGPLNITGDLTLNSTRRSIGQTGAWVVAGLAKISAGDNIILDNLENSFRQIEFTANKITLVHQNEKILNKHNAKGKPVRLSLQAVPRPKKDDLETK